MKPTTEPPNSLNLPFLEEMYESYLRDPESLAPEWRRYFEQLGNGAGANNGLQLRPSFRAPSLFNPVGQPRQKIRGGGALTVEAVERTIAGMQDRVDQLIRAYRSLGHSIARFNPLAFPRPKRPELDPKFYGFTEADMARRFSCQTMHCPGPMTLAEILDRLWNTYCRSIGVEYMHIDDLAVQKWLQDRMEPEQNRLQLSRAEQVRILTRLTDAVTFEEFIRKKFVGAKSFSLEGSESLIPLLDLAIEQAAALDIREIVLGMAHRGRLNVLANIMGKSPSQIFREFADAVPEKGTRGGDVKYHLGHSTDWRSASGKNVHLSLCFNPSHLEYVNTVVLGRVRAKQDRAQDEARQRCLALLIHGDAAFAGEGIVQETLNLSQLGAYSVGGTLHVVLNNQLGFTTGPGEGRSTPYATDVARMLPIPIFHVNGEDPEAVAQVVKLSIDFRQAFKRDVVIDMYGYRRLGHNEGDEPAFTQPLLYRAIQERKPVREGYLEHLLTLGGLTVAEAEQIAVRRHDLLEKELEQAQAGPTESSDGLRGIWSGYVGGAEPREEPESGVAKERLTEFLLAQTRLPKDFHPHPKIHRFLQRREAMARGEEPLDWSAAEALAFASIAAEGTPVRLTGQDTARGTFSQRHAVLHDYEDGHTYVPLQHVADRQGRVEIENSPLSEAGVLGFDYGYSLDYPDGLVLWEAQYGDFINAAQVIVDQFIASAEDKWNRLSGLVLLLPHGFEGQGPEHSSARLERFLELAAEDNLQVVYPSTPAQYFHCLRRQVVRRWRKPLVMMTPKSLLRHPQAVSSLDECARGHFQRIIAEKPGVAPEAVRRTLLCSGKIFYDLERQRQKAKREDVALLRLEQLYPLDVEGLRAALSAYTPNTPVFWVQEEPENMGAWRYLRVQFGEKLFGRFPFAGIYRPPSASPATGSSRAHNREQARIIEAAFGKTS